MDMGSLFEVFFSFFDFPSSKDALIAPILIKFRVSCSGEEDDNRKSFRTTNARTLYDDEG